MKKKCNRAMRILVIIGAFLIGMHCLSSDVLNVRAKENDFEIDAELLPNNEESYNIRVSVLNEGEDWEGTVRVIFQESYRMGTAYDTVLSLPSGSEKQFDVKIPMYAIEDLEGNLNITLYDKKQKECAKEEFDHFLWEGDYALRLGILSDEYDSLTGLDLSGWNIYYYGYEQPVALQELNQDTILNELDTLEFLVIDTYDTSVLSEEVLTAIEKWNGEGGVLIIGSGEYAEKTLALFEDSYLEVDCTSIQEPGNIQSYDYQDYVDWNQVHMASFWTGSGYYSQMPARTLVRPYGDGAISILPYALTEVVSMDDSFYINTDSQAFLYDMIAYSSEQSRNRYNNRFGMGNYNFNQMSRTLRMIGNINNDLQFDSLKIIIIAYVIFAGPILYLILRFLKKREWYWIAVPVTTLVGVMVVFFAGRGFEVKNTRAYSITTQDLSASNEQEIYMYCYDAGNKEWNVKLKDNYEYMGPFNSYYYNDNGEDYFHHYIKEGENLYVGIKPDVSFNDAFFAGKKAAGEERAEGTILFENIAETSTKAVGTITNTTEYDFTYIAVVIEHSKTSSVGDSLYVYEGPEAGETFDLSREIPVYISSFGYDLWNDYMYDIFNMMEEEETQVLSALSALGFGIFRASQVEADKTAYDGEHIRIVGLVENWEHVVDDDCTEQSFGCLYVVK